MSDLSSEDVYSSLEFQQYSVILDEEFAYYYARADLIEARRFEAHAVDQPSYQPSYLEYLRTPEWRERAETAKARFGRRCALCNVGGALEAHHRTYERVGHESPDDLTALCSSCHGAYHRWRIEVGRS
jgi:hypothetical protein